MLKMPGREARAGFAPVLGARRSVKRRLHAQRWCDAARSVAKHLEGLRLGLVERRMRDEACCLWWKGSRMAGRMARRRHRRLHLHRLGIGAQGGFCHLGWLPVLSEPACCYHGMRGLGDVGKMGSGGGQ
jgi:hypothetical protein